MSVNIQLGARVRRKNDYGMDEPGAVMRLSSADALVYWPQDNFYQLLPAVDLEPYGNITA